MTQAIWGIDVGEAKLAVAMLTDDGCETRTLAIAARRDPRRFALLHDQARTFLLDCPTDPLAVFVELPTGRFPNPWLTGAWATICAAATGLDVRYPHPVAVFSLAVAEWKKLTVGRGNADKDAVEAWARSEGFTGLSQDEADAYCIAVAGRLMLDRWKVVAA